MNGYIQKREKLNFLFGLSGQNLVYSLFGSAFFSFFMTDIAVFPPLTVTVLVLIMKIWDGINDPIVGSWIDKHTFKNGEKLRPFLHYTPLPVGIFTVLIFIVFPSDKTWLRVAYFIIMYICWDLSYTFQDVSMWGITACVSPDSNERDSFVQWARTIGSCVFAVGSAGIPMALEMAANALGRSLAFMTVVFAVIFGLGGAMMAIRCKEAKERIHPIPEEKQQSLWESFKIVFKNRMLMLVTLSNLLGSLGFGGSMVVYFFKYEFPADYLGENSIIGALGLTTIYGIVTGLPGFIGMILADKMKKWCKSYVNALIMMQTFNIIVRIIAFFIGFEGNNLWIALAVIGLGNIPMGACGIAQTSIFCDSIDYMEYKTGKRTEGITFSIQTSFTKISNGITLGLATLALHFLHFSAVKDEPGAVFYHTQTAAFDNWIWPLVILTPAIASLLYIIPLLFIRYTPEERKKVETELVRRRAAAENKE
jgi:Na+/melibiose symporter-like transporter